MSYFNFLHVTGCGFGKSYLCFLQPTNQPINKQTNKKEELVLDENSSSVLSSALGEICGTVLCLFDHTG
jgi:hypothetical protein